MKKIYFWIILLVMVTNAGCNSLNDESTVFKGLSALTHDFEFSTFYYGVSSVGYIIDGATPECKNRKKRNSFNQLLKMIDESDDLTSVLLIMLFIGQGRLMVRLEKIQRTQSRITLFLKRLLQKL